MKIQIEEYNFKVGDMVNWKSQSGGYSKRKQGKIVMVLVEKDCPANIANHRFPHHKRMFDELSLPGRNTKKAYFVEVTGGKTEKAIPKLYMPYPSKLRLTP